MKIIKTDFLVIGTGLAGLLSAIKLSQKGKVILLAKKSVFDSNSSLAQGGLAAVTNKDGDFESHIKDTLKAGAGLCDKKITEITVKSAPEAVEELSKLGVNFDKNGTAYSLGLEGGHSDRRILHWADRTGYAIVSALAKKASSIKNIKIFENYYAVDFILENHPKFNKPQSNSCRGVYAYNAKANTIDSFLAGKTFLATGGAGKAYLYTSNPDCATGDGFAMSWKAGLNLKNMEFVQFHPTCLYSPQARNFLISEALRGEGAVLLTKDGKRFMRNYSSRGELSPRDVVARAIDCELKKSGEDYVLLDISFKSKDFIKKRFPYIYQNCLKYGINPAKEPIPVVPAAHFFCGGVEVNENSLTNLKNLYALGEVSCTGLHGANRLASNSLLEAAVFAIRAAKTARQDYAFSSSIKNPKHYIWDYGKTGHSAEEVIITQNWKEIRTLMWNYVGIVRNEERLLKAEKRMKVITEEIEYYYNKYRPNKNFVELRNIAITASAVIKSCLMRKESRGLHYNEDYPGKADKPKNTVINRYL
ncbi:MAG: L-aspartate oxidase [Elusimicrobiota bacterium]